MNTNTSTHYSLTTSQYVVTPTWHPGPGGGVWHTTSVQDMFDMNEVVDFIRKESATVGLDFLKFEIEKIQTTITKTPVGKITGSEITHFLLAT